jgi:predicted ATPase
MMLKSWSIENFKPIVNSGELKLAPVTVLAGRNSSGKSSLLQSILMIAQTLSSKVVDRPLLPTGLNVQLGTFEDIFNVSSSSRVLTVGFELEFETEQASTSIDSNPFLKKSNVTSVRTVAVFNSASGNGTSSSAIEAAKVEVEKVSMEINATQAFFTEIEPYRNFAELKREAPYIKISFTVDKLSNHQLSRFLEKVEADYLRLVPYSGEQPNYIGNFEYQNEKTQEPVLVALSHFLPTLLVRKFREEERRLRSLQVSLRHKDTEGLEIFVNDDEVENISQAVAKITRFFTSEIRYLGPLRADPQASQKFAPSSELDDVGAKGEYAAAVYDANQMANIEWYNPVTKQIERGILKVALDNWVRYLDVANQIKIETAGQSGFNWQVVHKKGQKPLPLSAVGVGISQVLPILVMGLLAPKDTLLMVEQPELHLHPSVQARLGDFFVGLSKCNKQCLIETHSENLVSQLRYHIVQAGGMEYSDCIIYFVDQDNEGAARFEPVQISPQGNILNWPGGFFDETMLQEDRITGASIKKRANKVKNA